MQIDQLVSAESGWKAVFEELDGSQTTSRILGWAIAEGGGEIVGLIVDPSEPARIIPASEAASPEGGTFLRYRFVPPEPPPPPPPPPPAAAAPAAAADDKTPEPQEAAQQLAKSILKRRR